MPETLADKLAKIKRGDAVVLEATQEWPKARSSIFLSDLVAVGAVKRTLALSEGFCLLIEARNFTCAAALVRLQLDTAMRLFAATLMENSDAYAEAVFSGEAIDRMKDKDGNRLTDSYLAKKLNELHPWVLGVYKETCGLVHFTSRHIFSAIATTDEETRTAYFQVSAKDPIRPEEDYFEIVDGFFAAMKLTANLAAAWHMAKTMQNAPDPAEAAA